MSPKQIAAAGFVLLVVAIFVIASPFSFDQPLEDWSALPRDGVVTRVVHESLAPLSSTVSSDLVDLGYETSILPMFTSWEFMRGVDVGEPRTLLVRTVESYDDGSEAFLNWRYDLAFDLQGLGTRGSQSLYPSGTDRSGDVFIEEWNLIPRAGALVARRASPSSVMPVGQPTAYSEQEVFVLGGGLPGGAGRDVPARVVKDQVIVTDEVPYVRLLEADPEGRFLMMLGGNGVLYQVGLLGDDRGSLTPVIDSVAAWPFADEVWWNRCWVSRVQHSTLGRLWVFGNYGTVDPGGEYVEPVVVLVRDDDNDGVFTESQVMNESQAETLGYLDRQFYVDTFDGTLD